MKAKWVKILTLIVLSILLTWASIVMVHIPFILDQEEDFITKPTALKKTLNSSWFADRFFDRDFIRHNFLIINTTRDQELTYDTTNKLYGSGPGIPITNRSKLATLFKSLNSDTSLFNVIVCDVMFELSSLVNGADDSLQKYVNELQFKKKIIFGLYYKGEEFQKSVIRFDVKNTGSTVLETASGTYFKHSVYYKNKIKSLPYLLYERLHHTSIQDCTIPGFVKYQGSGEWNFYYNSFIPEMLIDRNDFDAYYNSNEESATFDKNMAICDLGTLVSDTTDITLRSLLADPDKKKTIVVGAMSDKHYDKHRTLYGTLDGIIILLNTYYCLELQYNRFYLLHIITCLLFFGFISYWLLYQNHNKESKKKSVSGWNYIWLLIRERMYYLVLALITLISYFGFSHSTNIIAMIIILEILDFAMGHIQKYKITKSEG